MMLAVIVPGLGGALLFFLWVWAVLDCIATDTMLCRNLPKRMWVILVVFVPSIGALAWLLLGRPLGAGVSLGGQGGYAQNPHRSTARGYEDLPSFKSPGPVTAAADHAPLTPRDDFDISESPAVRERRLLEWEAELQKREAEIAREPDLTTETGPDAEAD